MLIIAVFLPVLAGALLPLWHLDQKARAWYVMAATALTSLCVWGAMLLGGDGKQTLFYITERLPIAFRLDGFGRLYALIVSVLWPLCMLYALEYMEGDGHQPLFFSFYTMCYGVTLGIAGASNLITLYLFYEMLTLVTLPLVMHGGSRASVRAGLEYLYYSIGGAALAFLGLVFVISVGGDTEFVYGGLSALGDVSNAKLLRLGYLMCFFGFSVKAAVFPLHAWLPDASVAPTPVTALLHAVAVVKSGVFSVIRITWYVFGIAALKDSFAQYIPLTLAVFTITYGCLMALKEQNLKRRLAYSTVSNLSYILFGALLMTPEGLLGGLMHLLYHAMMKISLFLCAGIYLLKGRKQVRDLRGIAQAMPYTSGLFMLGALAMTGLPPLLGFASKWQLAEAAVHANSLLGMLGVISLIISATLTAFYLIVPGFSSYFTPGERAFKPGEMEGGWKAVAPVALIACCMLVVSFLPGPVTAALRAVAQGLL